MVPVLHSIVQSRPCLVAKNRCPLVAQAKAEMAASASGGRAGGWRLAMYVWYDFWMVTSRMLEVRTTAKKSLWPG